MFNIDIGVSADEMDVFSALWGVHGVGKTSLMTVLAIQALRRDPWRPVIAANPISVEKPGTLFLISNPGDLLAASLVLATWVYSPQARAIRKTYTPYARRSLFPARLGWRGTVVPGRLYDDANCRQVFEVLQADYRATAKRFTDRGCGKTRKLLTACSWALMSLY